jgi:hypothetical protein
VVQAAQEALQHIGSVIRNPEIQAHVPVLLKALDDPDAFGREALEALIHTNFVHTIDPASLSLIMPGYCDVACKLMKASSSSRHERPKY